MRLFPIISAIVVAALLYAVVLERDWLKATLGMGPAPDAVAQAVKENTPAPAQPDKRTVSVVAMTSQAQQIDNVVLLRGQTEAARKVEIMAETSGLIASAPLPKGSTVTQGQLLCEIDVGTRDAMLLEAKARLPEAAARLPEAEGRLAEAQARLEEAQINDNVAKRLSQDGFAADTRVAATRAAVQSALAGLETAKAGVEAARAATLTAQASIAAAEKELDRLQIKAPFNGVLETDTAELGALMQPGALCATVIQLDPMKLVGYAPETQVANLAIDAPAQARTNAGQEVQGLVTFISRSADPQTRTFRVEITVPNTDRALRDGQTAEIMIGSDGQLAHLLPASAMTLNDDGALGVQTARDSKAVFQPITVLRDTANGVWVGGLDETVDVIVTGQEYVIDGVTIEVTYAEGAS